jgi:hypothetical protein
MITRKNPYPSNTLQFAREELMRSIVKNLAGVDVSSADIEGIVRDIEYLCRILIREDKVDAII